MRIISEDNLLFILGNETRREILRLLTQEAHYPFQIAKILSVSQQTVERHLSILESAGIVLKTIKKSDEGPSRKYFVLKQSFFLSASIGPKTYDISVSLIPKEIPDKIVELPTILEDITEVYSSSNRSQVIDKFLQILEFLESNSHSFSRKQLEFLSLKQFVLHELYEHMTESGLEYNSRSTLWSALEQFSLNIEESEGTKSLEFRLKREAIKGIIQKQVKVDPSAKKALLPLSNKKKRFHNWQNINGEYNDE